MRYILLLMLLAALVPPRPGAAQSGTIDPSRQPTFKEAPAGRGGVTGGRSCVSAPYATRGGALTKKAEAVPPPYVPKHLRISASVTGTALREVATTHYDLRLVASAPNLAEAGAALATRRDRIVEALAGLDLPGLAHFLLAADARQDPGTATATAVLRIEVAGAPDPDLAARIAGAAGLPALRASGLTFANAERAAEDQRAELEAAVRAEAAEIAAARGQRLAELLESALTAGHVSAFGLDPAAAPVPVTASATFRVAPITGEASQ